MILTITQCDYCGDHKPSYPDRATTGWYKMTLKEAFVFEYTEEIESIKRLDICPACLDEKGLKKNDHTA